MILYKILILINIQPNFTRLEKEEKIISNNNLEFTQMNPLTFKDEIQKI